MHEGYIIVNIIAAPVNIILACGGLGEVPNGAGIDATSALVSVEPFPGSACHGTYPQEECEHEANERRVVGEGRDGQEEELEEEGEEPRGWRHAARAHEVTAEFGQR